MLHLASILFIALIHIPVIAQEDPASEKKIELQRNVVYTVPEGKTWTIEARLLDQITFCESEKCKEPIHFFRSVTQKAKLKKARIEGHITVSEGAILKTDRDIQILEQIATK